MTRAIFSPCRPIFTPAIYVLRAAITVIRSQAPAIFFEMLFAPFSFRQPLTGAPVIFDIVARFLLSEPRSFFFAAFLHFFDVHYPLPSMLFADTAVISAMLMPPAVDGMLSYAAEPGGAIFA